MTDIQNYVLAKLSYQMSFKAQRGLPRARWQLITAFESGINARHASSWTLADARPTLSIKRVRATSDARTRFVCKPRCLRISKLSTITRIAQSRCVGSREFQTYPFFQRPSVNTQLAPQQPPRIAFSNNATLQPVLNFTRTPPITFGQSDLQSES